MNIPCEPRTQRARAPVGSAGGPRYRTIEWPPQAATRVVPQRFQHAFVSHGGTKACFILPGEMIRDRGDPRRGREAPFQKPFLLSYCSAGVTFCADRKGTYFQQPFLLLRQKKWFLDFQRKGAGTMLMLPASISGAEVIRIVSASVPAQPLTLALIELLCGFSAAPAWSMPIGR